MFLMQRNSCWFFTHHNEQLVLVSLTFISSRQTVFLQRCKPVLVSLTSWSELHLKRRNNLSKPFKKKSNQHQCKTLRNLLNIDWTCHTFEDLDVLAQEKKLESDFWLVKFCLFSCQPNNSVHHLWVANHQLQINDSCLPIILCMIWFRPIMPDCK